MKSPSEVLDSYMKSDTQPGDVPTLFPGDAIARANTLLPEAKQALASTLRSGKWQAPKAIIDQILAAHVVDPNDPSTPAESIGTLNMICATRINTANYPKSAST